jgi:hypothetical protein
MENDTTLWKTECYKCEGETLAPEGTVHPLCDECELEFDAWMASAVRGGR